MLVEKGPSAQAAGKNIPDYALSKLMKDRDLELIFKSNPHYTLRAMAQTSLHPGNTHIWIRETHRPWQRRGGGYIIKMRSMEPDWKMEAAYSNPRSHVPSMRFMRG
jgi:hypothetical protein